MRVLLATDAFPPVCGGSGWSTFELAQGLRRAGHDVVVAQTIRETGVTADVEAYEGFAVERIPFAAPDVPFVRNYWKNERLWPRVADALTALVLERGVDVVHGQHALTCAPAVEAGRRAGRPAVCTVRDYWPICYWSDLIVDYGRQTLCPACSVGGMLDCLRPRAGVAWPVALPMIPYMRGNLARKARALSSADAVIAVSSVIGRDLLARCRGLSESRLHVIPNPVDLAWLAREVDSTTPPRAAPYAVYSGKLAPNKGIGKLVEAVARAGMRAPLVIVGDGPERARVEAAAAAAGLDVQLTGWLPRAEALRWVAHAAWLIFPSHGPESLSRVLLEAGALGVPVAAMDTGGTRDIVHHERTGLLSHDVEGLARDIRRLELDADLRARLGRAARAHVTETFDSTRVAPRVIDVYDSLVDLAPRGRHV